MLQIQNSDKSTQQILISGWFFLLFGSKKLWPKLLKFNHSIQKQSIMLFLGM